MDQLIMLITFAKGPHMESKDDSKLMVYEPEQRVGLAFRLKKLGLFVVALYIGYFILNYNFNQIGTLNA